MTLELINLLDAISNLPLDARSSLLTQANMLDGDFPDFKRGIVDYLSTDHASEWVAEHFEDNLEQYIDDCFEGTTSDWQYAILRRLLANYKNLTATEINDALLNEDIHHIVAEER